MIMAMAHLRTTSWFPARIRGLLQHFFCTYLLERFCVEAFLFSVTLASDGSFQALCNGDYLHPLRIEVWDWDRNGKHDHLGVLTTNLQALLEGQGEEMQLEVMQPFVVVDSFNQLHSYRTEKGIVHTRANIVLKFSI